MEEKEEYIFLKTENERLLDENQKLRIENAELKDQIQKYEAQLFDSGVSDFRNITPLMGVDDYQDSKNSEMIEISFQRDKVADVSENAALYVNSNQIQVSFDQLLPLSESTPQKIIDKTLNICFGCFFITPIINS